MKLLTKNIFYLPFITILFFCGSLVSSKACPACNIHNYLGSTVFTSSNIVIGNILSTNGANSSKVLVKRTLFGSSKPGQIISMRVQFAPRDTNTLFILSDPVRLGPSFEKLSLDYQNEVLFLLKLRKLCSANDPGQSLSLHSVPDEILNQYVITNTQEAITLLQGICNESKKIAVNYLQRSRPFPTRQIVQAVESNLQAPPGNDSVYLSYNRFANLVEALATSGTQEAQDYILQKTEWALKSASASTTNNSHFSSPRTLQLTTFLGASGTNWHPWAWAYQVPYRKILPKLIEKQQALLSAYASHMDKSLVRDVTEAMCESGFCSDKQMLNILKGTPHKNQIAEGIVWFCPATSLFSSKEQISAFTTKLTLARSLTTDPNLVKAIDQRMAELQKTNK